MQVTFMPQTSNQTNYFYCVEKESCEKSKEIRLMVPFDISKRDDQILNLVNVVTIKLASIFLSNYDVQIFNVTDDFSLSLGSNINLDKF